MKGSGYISRQCCGSTEIELGTVYAAEMGITLLSDIDRYTLEDAQVTLVFHLVLADDSVEDVPMGVFEVSEANRLAKCLELKAYDFMLRFDKSFNGFETVGTAYDFIALCCKRCKVEFANKRAEIDAMPNGGVTLSVYTENDIETCRDVLFYVAQVLGGFFIINREGKLELRKYGKDPVMKVEQRHRFSSSFSDFITRYTAVSSTNKQTQIAEYYALDPGDVLTFAGGQADEGWITCITSIRQKIGGKQSLKCVGKNPRLAQAKSRNDKNISGLLNQIEDNAKTGKIGIHTFTNVCRCIIPLRRSLPIIRIHSMCISGWSMAAVRLMWETALLLSADRQWRLGKPGTESLRWRIIHEICHWRRTGCEWFPGIAVHADEGDGEQRI